MHVIYVMDRGWGAPSYDPSRFVAAADYSICPKVVFFPYKHPGIEISLVTFL